MTRQYLTALVAVVAVIVLPATVRAGMIEISMAGTSLTYSDPTPDGAGSGSLTDSGTPTDALSSLTVVEDSNTLGVLVDPAPSLAYDLEVTDIPSIELPGPNGTTAVTAPAGGSFELLVDGSSALALDLESVNVVYSRVNSSFFDIRFMFVGTVGAISSQDLPFGVQIGEPVSLTFNVQQTATPTNDGTYLTSYVGNGTGVISSERVPEPSSLLLIGMCSVAGLAITRGLKRS
ncbi:PEP-CTERM sorting domain-containing protein [Aeoliella sp. ICT_H6.2]|uniref:PEP-CTERM sorting domain-containing protein n=1 Tax=Aeoliella straminimaris TaxID=2954799 RepID=A0A9X2FE45_9BACT|nr:PEP-CTERM sorting domain-containing protein [Aeoliella straminimaris]MCO6046533.1 PEP-CTERM sorting domain-containing protein [Aeoliella straminimaris]